jgi:hypothetical protein
LDHLLNDPLGGARTRPGEYAQAACEIAEDPLDPTGQRGSEGVKAPGKFVGAVGTIENGDQELARRIGVVAYSSDPGQSLINLSMELVEETK